MFEYEITINLDNSYDVVETVSANSEHKAMTECRQIIKMKYKPEKIWFINIKKK